ncbi:MAG: glycosyl hydrolase family 43 [Lentisphaerae bacterium]|nr:glycosyl hydrolase family 43 [Lentisphaerota bacterium]
MIFGNDLHPALKIDGCYVWCGSVIRGEDGRYHMFASRWKREHTFHPGWSTHSEVVRAVADTPAGPFEFQEVVLPARGPEYWDGSATHCPQIVKRGNQYLLFYIGTSCPLEINDENRIHAGIISRASKRIGMAEADSVFGPWKRSDAPAINTKPGTFYSYLVSNPAPVIEPDGSIFVIFKTRKYIDQSSQFSQFYIGAARAADPESPFEVITPEPLFGPDMPGGVIEDPFLWIDRDGVYHMLAKDMLGTIAGCEADGMEFVSENGLDWKFRQVAYNRGTLALRERPFILFDDNKDPVALYTATAEIFPYRNPVAQTWNSVCLYKK